MPFVKGLAILAVSSLVAAGGAHAGLSMNNGARPKEEKPPAAVEQITPPAASAVAEAPIVMGRSVAIVRKSKLHHIKPKPAKPTIANKN
jgi:hypothetical protein